MATVECPICRESIQATALRCRYCGHVLVPDVWRAEYVEWKRDPVSYERERLPDFSEAQRSLFSSVVATLEDERPLKVTPPRPAEAKRAQPRIRWVVGGLVLVALLPAMWRITRNATQESTLQRDGGLSGPTSSGSPAPSRDPVSMHEWAQEYRSAMQELLYSTKFAAEFHKWPKPICRQLKAGVDTVVERLRKTPDPVINDSVQSIVDGYAGASRACLDDDTDALDLWLWVARSGVVMLEEQLKYRYQESGVPGLREALEAATEGKK